MLPVLVLAGCLLASGPVQSASPRQSNAVIARCVESEFRAERTGVDCIGRFAEPCMLREDMQAHTDQLECLEREFVLWRAMMNDTLADLRGLVRGRALQELEKSQDLWSALHKTNCRLPYHLHEDEKIAQPVGLYCSIRAMANRALELRGWRQGLDR